MSDKAIWLAVLLIISCCGQLLADTFGSGANQFSIDFVTIGNPANPADTTGSPNPAGSVPYVYRIGKYETSEDMVAKANTLGNLNFLYSSILRWPNKPATGLSWFMAARFVNWLNTSSGYPPAYKFDYQPGEPRYNANDLVRYWSLSDPGYQADNRIRNKLAKYFLPSDDEWYKAAYYDPVAEHYWDYPTGSDTPPDGIDFVGDTQFDAVFRDGGTLRNPFDVMNVGVLSPYGTAGQGGNVYEWQETPESPTAPFPAPERYIRGGNI